MIVLEELDTEFGIIKIMRSRLDGTCRYYQDLCFHSGINTDGVSICGYVHVMYSIIAQSKARRVLMIGCAGGTLATMLHRLGCEITVVDINPHAFTLAKRYFQMPEGIECVVDDGWSYLIATGQRYDAIAIDAFTSDGTIPEQFTKKEFFLLTKKVLDPFGVLVMNVMVEHDLDMLADHIALNIESAKIPTALFDCPGRYERTVIIAGGAVDHIQISSSRKPEWVREELHGIVRRSAKTQMGQELH
jgi:protein-L-isoaspartate O-methyltransferase